MDDQRHHYIPCFYTKRWVPTGGKYLCQFSRPYQNRVTPKRVVPAGTGFASNLYKLRHGRPGKQHSIEEFFFRPIDTRAADALASMEQKNGIIEMDPLLRVAWVHFLMTLLMRMPEDIALMKASYAREFSYVTEMQRIAYLNRREASWPKTYDAAIASQSPEDIDTQALRLATKLMKNARIEQKLLQMSWASIDLGMSNRSLLTSDRPILITGKLGAAKTRLILPIGPNRIFAAAYDHRRARQLQSRSSRQWIVEVNRAVSETAQDYVYDKDDTQLPYIRSHFGINRRDSILRQLVDHIEMKRGPSRSPVGD